MVASLLSRKMEFALLWCRQFCGIQQKRPKRYCSAADTCRFEKRNEKVMIRFLQLFLYCTIQINDAFALRYFQISSFIHKIETTQ